MSTQANLPADACQPSFSSDQQRMAGDLLQHNVRDLCDCSSRPRGFRAHLEQRRARAPRVDIRRNPRPAFSRFHPAEDVASGQTDTELRVAAREGRLEDEGCCVRKDGTRFGANVVITASSPIALAVHTFVGPFRGDSS
jgi:hypothetical protein